MSTRTIPREVILSCDIKGCSREEKIDETGTPEGWGNLHWMLVNFDICPLCMEEFVTNKIGK